MSKPAELEPKVEAEVDKLVSDGTFPSFQSALNELVRLGLMQLRSGPSRRIPPGSVPTPDGPTVPDPSRDILRM